MVCVGDIEMLSVHTYVHHQWQVSNFRSMKWKLLQLSSQNFLCWCSTTVSSLGFYIMHGGGSSHKLATCLKWPPFPKVKFIWCQPYYRTWCSLPLAMSRPSLNGITQIYLEKSGKMLFQITNDQHLVESWANRLKFCNELQGHPRYVHAKIRAHNLHPASDLYEFRIFKQHADTKN